MGRSQRYTNRIFGGQIVKLETLNDKIIYAKGWNDAVKRAIEIAFEYEELSRITPDWSVNGLINELRELDRSIQATDD